MVDYDEGWVQNRPGQGGGLKGLLARAELGEDILERWGEALQKSADHAAILKPQQGDNCPRLCAAIEMDIEHRQIDDDPKQTLVRMAREKPRPDRI